jgi:homopolymeric O-antigen transport system ATP-binding protein
MALSVEDIGKRYWLRQRGPTTFQQTLLRAFRGARSTPFWALQHVSFHIVAGESVGVIGSNGAGKTTLLRLLCGLGRPTNGAVRVNGRVAALLTLGAGFHPELTGRENLYVSAVVSGLRRRDVRRLFDTIVKFAELEDFIDQPFRTYSSGMQMRLGFSIAIHVDPAVLIIDEALSVGDAHFQQKCLDRIEQFRRAGKTLLIVSHDMNMIRTFCTRALWFKRGALVADGPTEQVVAQYGAAVERETLSVTRNG